jgi:hypothetical protein
MKKLEFTTAMGKSIAAILRGNGEPYGLNDCLTVDKGAQLEFQPIASDGKSDGCGWTYYARTICDGTINGLCLQGDCREWDIDPHTMAAIRQWAGNEIRNQSLEWRAPGNLESEVPA